MNWEYCNIKDFSDEEYEISYKNLSPTRKKRIDRLKLADDKKRSVAADILVKKILVNEYNKNDVLLENYENGQPYLKNSGLFVSISHSKDMVVCAVDKNPIGIDIEYIKPITTTLAKRVCTKNEVKYLGLDTEYTGEITDSIMLERFFEIWTGKEAYFKKVGTGITDFKSIEALNLNRKHFKIDNYYVQIVCD